MDKSKEDSAILSMLRKASPHHQSSNSIKFLTSTLSFSETKNIKDFIPFIKERDSIGRLLSNHESFKTLHKRSESIPGPVPSFPKQNVAFLRSKAQVSSRVCKKSNDFLPVGLYNPRPYDSVHLPISKAKRFGLCKKLRRSSLDYADISEIYSKNKSSPQKPVLMEKQLSRKMIEEPFISEQKFLLPRVVLPEYLDKLKGLYHSGVLAQSKIYNIRKDASERTMELKEHLNQHISSLRNINTFYKKYGTKCAWKLSSELF
jgi:hypothetical protein